MKVEVTGLGRKHVKNQKPDGPSFYNGDGEVVYGGYISPDILTTRDGTKMKTNEDHHITEITFPNGVELEMVYDEESKMMLTVKVTGPIVEVYESPETGRDASVLCYIDEEIK